MLKVLLRAERTESQVDSSCTDLHSARKASSCKVSENQEIIPVKQGITSKEHILGDRSFFPNYQNG